MAVPYTFAGATSSIPLSQLDQNFATPITIGTASVQLGNTVTTLTNMTLVNATISSGSFTGTLANATVSNVTVDSANTAGYVGIPQNSQNGNYNVVLADAGKHIFHPAGQAANTVTIPANGNVAFTIGTTITFINMSANATTIALTTDTMYLSGTGTTGSRTLAQYGVATAVKIGSTAWIISGSGLT